MNAAILSFPDPVVITQMVSATELCIDIVSTSDHKVLVQIHLVGAIETWSRLPERRQEVRPEQCEYLREAASLVSLPEFRRVLADCGFAVQS